MQCGCAGKEPVAEQVSDLTDPELIAALRLRKQVDDFAHAALLFATGIEPRDRGWHEWLLPRRIETSCLATPLDNAIRHDPRSSPSQRGLTLTCSLFESPEFTRAIHQGLVAPPLSTFTCDVTSARGCRSSWWIRPRVLASCDSGRDYDKLTSRYAAPGTDGAHYQHTVQPCSVLQLSFAILGLLLLVRGGHPAIIPCWCGTSKTPWWPRRGAAESCNQPGGTGAPPH